MISVPHFLTLLNFKISFLLLEMVSSSYDRITVTVSLGKYISSDNSVILYLLYKQHFVNCFYELKQC